MRSALTLLIFMLVTGCGRAEPGDRAAQHSPEGLAVAEVTARDAGATMSVTSSAIGADGRLDERQSAYGANLSPAISWKAAPGAAAYAIILEDPDAHGPKPFVHWLIWNIPGLSTDLPAALPATARLDNPAGAVQGRNGAGGMGYWGPRPPTGTGVHRYHFQLFALDRTLDLAPGADRDALVAAMKGHAIADGDLVGAFAAPGG